MTPAPGVLRRAAALALLAAAAAVLVLLGGGLLLRGVLAATPAGASSVSGCGEGPNTSVVDVVLNGVDAVTLTTVPIANANGTDRAIAIAIGTGTPTACLDDTGAPEYVTEVTSIVVSSPASTNSLTVNLANGPFGPDGDVAPGTTTPSYAPCAIAISGTLPAASLTIDNVAPVPLSAGGPSTTGVTLGTAGADLEAGACSAPDLTAGPVASYTVSTPSGSTALYTLSAQGSALDGTGGAVAVPVTLTDNGQAAVLIPGDPGAAVTDTLTGSSGTTVDESGAPNPVNATLGATSGTLAGGYGGSGTVSLSGVGILKAPTGLGTPNSASFATVSSGVTVVPGTSCGNELLVTDTSPTLSYTLCGFANLTGSSAGSNTMTAGSGTISFTAAGGSNTMTAGSGNDTFSGTGNDNTFNGGSGTGTDTFS
ncbi:MAG TPA: hypothetical protein VGG09_12595, partial [Acidimicrobiales bacterium]